jgi:energy-coupling factor transport system ATP-binding protein
VARSLAAEPGAARALRAWAAPAAASPAPGRSDPAVEVQSVCYERILAGATLAIRAGEIFALVGANGAGKTTLAQVVAGLLRPSAGEVRLFGSQCSTMRPRELARLCGLVFQNPEHQFVAETVYEEIAFGLHRLGEPEEVVRSRVRELIASLGLEGKEKASPFDLSGGQKRRLSVASMLACARRLLILDEPTFGQDAASSRGIGDMILRLNRQGATIVIISHDMELVHDLAWRAAVVDHGRIARVDETSRLFRDAALLEAAGLEAPPQVAVVEALAETAAA